MRLLFCCAPDTLIEQVEDVLRVLPRFAQIFVASGSLSKEIVAFAQSRGMTAERITARKADAIVDRPLEGVFAFASHNAKIHAIMRAAYERDIPVVSYRVESVV